MRLLIIICLICFSGFNNVHASPAEIKKWNCFSGSFASYEKWISMLVSKNGGESEELRMKLETMFPEASYDLTKNTLRCTNFIYESNGHPVHGFLVRPQNVNMDNKLPVIVYNRGGNGTFGAINFAKFIEKIFPMAMKGYVVIGSQYSGFPSSKNGDDEFGGKDVDDVKALFAIIDSLPFANSNRVALFGFSRGGIMAFSAAKQSKRKLAIALASTPTDLELELKFRPEMEKVYKARIPNYEKEKSQQLRERSIVHMLEDVNSEIPILIFNTFDDEKVFTSSNNAFLSKLKEKGFKFKIVTYSDGGHEFKDSYYSLIDELDLWLKELR